MGCCGQDEEDALLHTLLQDRNPSSDASSEAPAEVVLSPMNSNISVLGSRDLLRSILELLPSSDLARAACVCRVWREVASEREVLERAFREPWKVRRIIGSPSSAGFWRYPGLDRFAISHRLLRGDTVASVALRHSVQVMDIKRLNSMMSDHGIYSRERLLVPIRNPELLQDSICYIELDEHAKREAAVLYLEGEPNGKSAPFLEGFITERGRKKILDSIKRSLHVDDETAVYYLSISNNNPREAFLQFSEDLQWEQRQYGFHPTEIERIGDERYGRTRVRKNALGIWRQTMKIMGEDRAISFICTLQTIPNGFILNGIAFFDDELTKDISCNNLKCSLIATIVLISTY